MLYTLNTNICVKTKLKLKVKLKKEDKTDLIIFI